MNEITHFDKFAHIGMYGGLSLVLWIEYLRSHTRFQPIPASIRVALFPLLLSGSIELLQAYCTENRSGEWLDFAANSLGVSIAYLLGYTLLRPLLYRKR
ncbi:MAG: VanZ family protein [Phocaeicola sp.]